MSADLFDLSAFADRDALWFSVFFLLLNQAFVWPDSLSSFFSISRSSSYSLQPIFLQYIVRSPFSFKLYQSKSEWSTIGPNFMMILEYCCLKGHNLTRLYSLIQWASGGHPLLCSLTNSLCSQWFGPDRRRALSVCEIVAFTYWLVTYEAAMSTNLSGWDETG